MSQVKCSLPLPGGRRTIDWVFTLGKVVDSGDDATLVEAVGRKVGADHETPYMIQIIEHGGRMIADFQQVQNILRHIDHLYILKIFTQFTHKEQLYVVFEKTDCALTDKVAKCGKLQDHEAKVIFKQLLKAVKHLHTKGLCHRSICPSNILFDESGAVKLAGFESAACPQPSGEVLFDSVPTPADSFAAPELQHKYHNGKKIDIYSLGAILHFMLTGLPPTDGVPSTLPKDVKSLVAGMLHADWAAQRFNLSEVEAHCWLNETAVRSPQRVPNTPPYVDSSPLRRRGPSSVLSLFSPNRDGVLSPAANHIQGCPGLALSPPGSPASKVTRACMSTPDRTQVSGPFANPFMQAALIAALIGCVVAKSRA